MDGSPGLCGNEWSAILAQEKVTGGEEMKTDDLIARQVKNRIKAKKLLLKKLRFELEQIKAEIERVWWTDTAEDLAKEFGIGKSTVYRIGNEK